jgi:hypothetical protein
LALFSSTQLPLVIAITTLAVEGGHMRSSTAAALVGAAVLSTLVYPILGLRPARRPAGRGFRARSRSRAWRGGAP